MYKILAEVDLKVLFEGTKAECDKVMKAFTDYGLLERKFIIEEPKHNDFKLPESTKEEIKKYLIDMKVDGMDYDYKLDIAEAQFEDYTDYELYLEYQGYSYNPNDDETLDKAEESFNSYQADKILLEN